MTAYYKIIKPVNKAILFGDKDKQYNVAKI